MCSFFLLERLRKDSEWFAAGTPVAHRPVVWEHTSADFLLIQARLGTKCLCSITRAQNGQFKTSCLWIFFLFFFPLPLPGWCLTLFLTCGVELGDHGPYGFRAAEAWNPHCACYRPPCAFVQEPPSCSMYVHTQIRQIHSHLLFIDCLLAHLLFIDPMLSALWCLDKKQDRKATGWAKESPGGSKLFRGKSVLGKCFLRPFRSTGPHTSPMEWGHPFVLGNTAIFLRAEKVTWSL